MPASISRCTSSNLEPEELTLREKYLGLITQFRH
jgi:hypothetical protein